MKTGSKLNQIIRMVPIQKRSTRKKRNEKDYRYKDLICSFDIETTNLKTEEQSFMYIWQFCIYYHGIHRIIMGRTWKQFLEMVDYICNALDENERIIVFVHNLDFEFTYLSGIYHFKADDVFCLDKRRIGKCVMKNKIEFRCTFKLTNLPLSTWCKQMDIKHKKLDGEKFDYSIIRTPGRALKRYELNYCINDVLGLCECVEEKNRREGDDLYSMPLTATGYIRRECRKDWNKLNYHFRYDIQPDLDCLLALHDAFRGGNTHGNRCFAFDIISNVPSADRSSSYPEVLINHEYPGGKMCRIGPMTTKEINYKLTKNHLALLMIVKFKSLKLKDFYCSNPYIPKAKCTNYGTIYEDNGRVLEIEKDEWIEMTITDVDLRIICSQYDFDGFECLDSWGTTYKPLPDPLKALVIKYYKLKTELKGVDDKIYMASKERLNSIYGMMVQYCLRPNIIYDRDNPEEPYLEKYEDKQTRLDKYNKKGFLPFQFGVWCTAWARFELQRGIDLVEAQGADMIYSDTDSVKYHENAGPVSFDAYNEEKIRLAEKNGAWADDPKGNRHYMGVFEYEGMADRFVTYGAKKYICEKHGQVEITISGVPKKKGALELARKGGIEAFKEGFLFEDAGLAVKYNDYDNYWTKVNGEDIHITPNIYLYTDTYLVTTQPDYSEAVRLAKQILTEDGKELIISLEQLQDD